MSATFNKLGFLTLNAGQSITIQGEEGLTSVNIFVLPTSTGNCTLSGSFGIGGLPSGSIAIVPGYPSFTVSGDNENSIDDLVITAGSGCTVYVSGKKLIKN